MGPDPKILDDITRLAGGAANIVSGLQQQIRDEIKSRIEDMADRMDLVPREDVDRLEAMIVKMRKDQTALEKRITELEGRTGPARKTARKTAVKKTAKKTAAKSGKSAAKKSAKTKKATKKKKTS